MNDLKDKLFSNFVLFVALALSTIAAWYSIIGLTAIFAGAVVPIIIMGGALEVAKIATTVWLKKYWTKASWVIKLYLVPAVVLLALLTSMGIFGFLSKAHMDQGIGTGDVTAKVALLDEKIAMQRETIKSSKAALSQMDMQVNDIVTKGDSERSVERSVMIRKQQAKERASLLKDIEVANKEIQKLNEERAPIASEMRKAEAEVGPIKYIAALIYGDNPDQNVLERAVRWVIILLVIVFDPLAIMLVLAANASRKWDEEPAYEEDDGPLAPEQIEQIVATAPTPIVEEIDIDHVNQMLAEAVVVEEPFIEEPKPEPVVIEATVEEEEAFNELSKEPKVEVAEETKPEPEPEPLHTSSTTTIEELMADTVDPVPEVKILAMGIDDVERPGDYVTTPDFETEGVTKESYRRIQDSEYVEFEGKRMHERVLRDLRPDFFDLKEDEPVTSSAINFGNQFPEYAVLSDIFIRIDALPHRVYKFNGRKWIEISRENSDVYLSSTNYLQYLIDKISTGEFDPEYLTPAEQDAVSEQLRTQKG